MPFHTNGAGRFCAVRQRAIASTVSTPAMRSRSSRSGSPAGIVRFASRLPLHMCSTRRR